MSQRDRLPGVDTAADKLSLVFDSISRFALTIGGAAGLIGVGFLIANFATARGAGNEVQILQNAQTFGMVAVAGLALSSIAIAYLQWGEEILGPLLLIVWGALFFSPMYLPSMFGNATPTASSDAVLGAIQRSGIPVGVVGMLALVFDFVTRARIRIREGAKADQMKYGKGLKEEKDVRNVFLGKCWQLPYCRKFVRERCPIYHARRTCWKERVGCMCEESVIRNAMAGKLVPEDPAAAAKLIPLNHKLTLDQKKERCRQCTIFNEHQKHKYKLAMPTAIGGMVVVYVAFHEPMSNGVKGAITGIDKFYGKAINRKDDSGDISKSGLGTGEIAFHELILVALLIVALAYVIRFVEYMFFRAKL